MSDPATNVMRLEQALFETRRVVVGQYRVLERILACMLAGGHCLLEGVPGIGKTMMLSTMARVMGGSFARIQFTPDLVPSDIVGTRIWRASREEFDTELGPIFANFVLADEINRAPAKVQSALLEVMQERQVTIGGVSHPAPAPFFVLATQNPIESEGVYPLPEAQRDRFLMRVPVDYPTPAEEREIVRRMEVRPPQAERILTIHDVAALQKEADAVFVDPGVEEYAVRLVLATRDPHSYGLPDLDRLIAYGASPRASIGLVRAARGMAILRGRTYALPQDVYDVAYDILNHRLILSYEALADGVSVDEVLVELLSTVPAPRVSPRHPEPPASAPPDSSAPSVAGFAGATSPARGGGEVQAAAPPDSSPPSSGEWPPPQAAVEGGATPDAPGDSPEAPTEPLGI